VQILLEKTCANTLRVPFVRQVFPEARLIHIVRDGRDVIPSAFHRWRSTPTWSYRLRKAAFLPASALFRQGLRYLFRSLQRTAKGPPPRWGPHYPGMEADLQRCSLERVCAQQWTACVTATLDALATLPPKHVLTVHYETLVSDPRAVNRIAAFLDLDCTQTLHAYYTATLRRDTIGHGRKAFDAATWNDLQPHIRPTLQRLGYR
jgi:hypothetical protein